MGRMTARVAYCRRRWAVTAEGVALGVLAVGLVGLKSLGLLLTCCTRSCSGIPCLVHCSPPSPFSRFVNLPLCSRAVCLSV